MRISLILSLIFSIFLMLGISFDLFGNISFFTNYTYIFFSIFSILVVLNFKIINFLFKKLDTLMIKEKNDNIKNNKIIACFEKNPFLFSLIFIIICWLIYIIAFYPCIMSKDPTYQILQYFGIDNKYSYYSVLLDKNVIITNHHPVIHTLLIGSCVKIGTLINNVNLGLFLYSIIQILFLSITLSYTISYMKKLNINNKYIISSLIIYSITPVFPFYAMSPVKDVIFSSLIILYNIIFSKIVIYEEKNIEIKNIINIILLMILIILFRHNGIYIITLSFPFLLLKIRNKTNKLKIILIFIVALAFQYTYKNIVLPYYKITPTSIREVLSIPFQQTARYVKYHNNEISEKEQKAIDKILNYNTLAERYNPELSDSVKNEFNKYSTKKDLVNYFKVWYNQLRKHPITYIDATLNNIYGYIYPFKVNWYIYYKENKILNKYSFDYHYNNFNNLRRILTQYAKHFPFYLIIGLIVNIGFSNWLLLFMIFYLIYRKKYKETILFLPSIIILLVCFASPANTYFRYAMPNIFSMPIIIASFFKIASKK